MVNSDFIGRGIDFRLLTKEETEPLIKGPKTKGGNGL